MKTKLKELQEQQPYKKKELEQEDKKFMNIFERMKIADFSKRNPKKLNNLYRLKESKSSSKLPSIKTKNIITAISRERESLFPEIQEMTVFFNPIK